VRRAVARNQLFGSTDELHHGHVIERLVAFEIESKSAYRRTLSHDYGGDIVGMADRAGEAPRPDRRTRRMTGDRDGWQSKLP